jgi:hypothetical protein
MPPQQLRLPAAEKPVFSARPAQVSPLAAAARLHGGDNTPGNRRSSKLRSRVSLGRALSAATATACLVGYFFDEFLPG